TKKYSKLISGRLSSFGKRFSGSPDLEGTYKNCRKIKRKFRLYETSVVLILVTTRIRRDPPPSLMYPELDCSGQMQVLWILLAG
ncbi:MAG: hypothetical protein PVH37_20625, partial [Desulfobacterales bacterium]